MLNSFKRIVRTGFKSFSRNMGLSIATIFIMIMVISLITILFIINPISRILIESIEKRVDISVYFKEDVADNDITRIKSEIARAYEVKEVSYISKEEALEIFVDRHKDDPILIESLTEIGYNPFLASLSIRTWEPSQYEQITNLLEASSFQSLIDNVDYYQRRPVIEKVFSLTSGINRIVFFFSIILAIIAVLISFNSIRIAIHNSSQEISTMKLVGASNSFVRGPFLIQGIIVGFIAALMTLLITFGLSYGFNERIRIITPDINVFSIFVSNFFLLFLIQLATGIGLGVISSYLAIRKYLKV